MNDNESKTNQQNRSNVYNSKYMNLGLDLGMDCESVEAAKDYNFFFFLVKITFKIQDLEVLFARSKLQMLKSHVPCYCGENQASKAKSLLRSSKSQVKSYKNSDDLPKFSI